MEKLVSYAQDSIFSQYSVYCWLLINSRYDRYVMNFDYARGKKDSGYFTCQQNLISRLTIEISCQTKLVLHSAYFHFHLNFLCQNQLKFTLSILKIHKFIYSNYFALIRYPRFRFPGYSLLAHKIHIIAYDECDLETRWNL